VSSQTASTFDEHADIYELLVDWPRRLAAEEPLYRRVFQQVGVCRVLDAACGTGHQAAMFASWGLQAEGADISPGMIAQARARFGESASLTWAIRSYDQPVEAGQLFDAVICVGNSLALAGDLAVVERAVHNMMAALRSGGVCIIGVLNLWKLPEGKTLWQKCQRVQYRGADHVLLKSVHRCGDRGHIDFADLDLSGGGAKPRYDAAEFLGIHADWLMRTATAQGAASVECYGSYGFEAYDPARSTDLVVTCRRA
jgi:SAM-dependent methyltransferase